MPVPQADEKRTDSQARAPARAKAGEVGGFHFSLELLAVGLCSCSAQSLTFNKGKRGRTGPLGEYSTQRETRHRMWERGKMQQEMVRDNQLKECPTPALLHGCSCMTAVGDGALTRGTP